MIVRWEIIWFETDFWFLRWYRDMVGQWLLRPVLFSCSIIMPHGKFLHKETIDREWGFIHIGDLRQWQYSIQERCNIKIRQVDEVLFGLMKYNGWRHDLVFCIMNLWLGNSLERAVFSMPCNCGWIFLVNTRWQHHDIRLWRRSWYRKYLLMEGKSG